MLRSIQSLNQQGRLFISRAPQKLKQVKKAISEQHTLNFKPLENGYSGAWLNMNYGDVEQCWLLVRSEQAKKSEQKTLDKKMLSFYKSQQSVELGFRFLKSPDFLTSSLYLKKPERIEALLMVMTCCLMIYAALEYKIRQELQDKTLTFLI